MIFKLKYDETLPEEINGKYVWLIQIEGSDCTVYPLEELSVADYIRYIYAGDSTSYNPEKAKLVAQSDIDVESTDEANNIEKYLAYNEIVPADGEATIDDMKAFRKNVAILLQGAYASSTDSQLLAMLNYYVEDMNDNVVKGLMEFRNVSAQIAPTGAFVDCGCATKPLALNLGTVSVCDPMESYRKSVHDYMVLKFSDYTFWKELITDNLNFIISMLKGIVSAGFPIVGLSGTFGYGDCSCLSYGSAQESAMKILNNLITSFEYIRDEEAEAHKNFVYSTLNSWASALYEVMSW